MNLIKDMLEITLNRSSNLQISSVAFPVGSRAFLLAGYCSLVHPFTWHLHLDVLFSEVEDYPLPRALLHDGHLEKIQTWTSNITIAWYCYWQNPSWKSIWSTRQEQPHLQWCLLLHTISFRYPSLCSLPVTFFHFSLYFLFKCLFQLLNPRCFSFFSWHSGCASGNHHDLAKVYWVSGGRPSDPDFCY